jgi:hypothetical protein
MLFRTFQVLTNTGVPLPYQLIISLRNIVPFLGWIYIYKLNKYVPSDALISQRNDIMFLGDRISILQSVNVGVMLLIWTIYHDECNSSACDGNLARGVMPLGTILYVVMGSFAMPMFYTCHHVYASLVSIVITYSMMLATAIVMGLANVDKFAVIVIGIIIFYSMASFEGIIFSNYSNYSKFASALLVKVASENKEYLMKIQTEEMRHMIGENHSAELCCVTYCLLL